MKKLNVLHQDALERIVKAIEWAEEKGTLCKLGPLDVDGMTEEAVGVRRGVTTAKKAIAQYLERLKEVQGE